VIGIISRDSEIRAVQEFFQLFKTPWEFYVPHHNYDIVLVTSDEIPAKLSTRVVVIYNSRSTGPDDEISIATRLKQGCEWLEWNGIEFPIYRDVSFFQPSGLTFLRRWGKLEVAGLEVRASARRTVRIGYDLFQEVSFLLSKGQPPENAHIPTLEIHISLLRSCILNAGIPFVEVPPVPAGYDFMACLTHDVDFTGIRRHKLDRTMWGFIYRALAGSLIGALRGRMAWTNLLQNWKAVFSLPLVYLGLQDDFWLEFDRYMQIEKYLGSTFFFVPFKNLAGVRDSGAAPKRRAAKYDITEIKEQVRELLKHGCEVGLHGIDAWHDSHMARNELSRIREVTKTSEVGVRMHWLYFAESSPKALEEAGFSYDSTFGYNDAVGFRGGTTQAFCPPAVEDLLELSLNIQDTAMFYPRRMGLSETEALDSCKRLIEFTAMFGGVLTLNWHTRSLSPERLWGDFYFNLLKQIESYRVWFGTAEEIVKWFRKRRALCFEQVHFIENTVRVKMTGPSPGGQPPFLVRIHHPKFKSSVDTALRTHKPAHSDIAWRGETELRIAS
jgi:hypothetical protein